MEYCSYFQAHVAKESTWFFVATLRANEHMQFDRTLDKSRQLFEFFVPADYEKKFCDLMHWYQTKGIVTDIRKMPNRLITEKL